MAAVHLDAKGLVCPLPVLRARKALKGLADGDHLLIEATDPAAPTDLAALCAATGHRLLGSALRDGVYHVGIEKAGSTALASPTADP